MIQYDPSYNTEKAMKIIYQWVWHGIVNPSWNLVVERSICNGKSLNCYARPCTDAAPVFPTHPMFEDVMRFTEIFHAR